jgi:long-chain fatty acid transport protein
VLTSECRYIDYANADGFRQSGFAPSGAVQGLGWRSIFGVIAGAQYQWTDAVSVRLGYSFNQDPVPASQATINAAAPTLIEHTVSAGASWRVSDALVMSLAYVHGFENSITGPLHVPAGVVPGASVRNTAAADTFLLGATVQFGPCGRKRGETPCGCAPETTELAHE